MESNNHFHIHDIVCSLVSNNDLNDSVFYSFLDFIDNIDIGITFNFAI